MVRELVTVARFDIPATAHIARNALEAAGIKAVVQDEQLVAMDYLLSLAVGGIKLQVWEEDAERALSVLASVVPVDSKTPGYLELSAESGDDSTVLRADTNDRDRYAGRAFLASLCSLLVFPVAFYTAYLMVMALFSEGQLTTRRRWAVLFAALITPVILFLSLPWVAAMHSLITTSKLPE